MKKIEIIDGKRRCSCCKDSVLISLFSKRSKTSHIYKSWCNPCINKKTLLYREENMEKYLLASKASRLKRYSDNKQIISEKTKLYRIKNGDAIRLNRRIYNTERKDIISFQQKVFRNKDIEETRRKRKEYYYKNKERFALKNKEYRIKDKVKPINRLSKSVRSRIWMALKRCGYKKDSYTSTLIGLDYDKLKIYIENQFKKGMLWENYGEWHIDHKIPLSSAKTEEELLKLFHYTNLQPLWAKENLSKGSKIIEHQLKIAI